MSADDLHARFDAAADDLVPPADPVGLVRARVGQRRRRRTQARVAAVSTAAVAVLVTAVVVGPDGFTPDAVAPAGAPTGPSEGSGPLLSPDGLPGLRLGDPAPETDDYGARLTASGCEAASSSLLRTEELRTVGGEATEVTVWIRDGAVVSLLLVVAPDRVLLPGDVPRTWLGPTLRDPVARAVELEGAQLVTDDPLGDAGPAITSVVVPLDGGGEVVFSDAPVSGVASEGRISTITLRPEAGRGCAYLPADFEPPMDEEPVVLTAQGLEGLVLGDPVDPALVDGRLTEVENGSDVQFGDPLDGRGCTAYRTTDGADVIVDDGRVVAAAVLGRAFILGDGPLVESGRPAAEVEALPGAVAARAPVTQTGGAVDVPVGPGLRARVVTVPGAVALEAAGVVVEGAPRVFGVVVYEGDEPADSLC